MSEYFCSYVPQELEDNSRQNYQVSAKFSKILFCSVLFELFANATQNLQTASFVAELYLFLFQQYLLSVKFLISLDNFLLAKLASARRFLNLLESFKF